MRGRGWIPLLDECPKCPSVCHAIGPCGVAEDHCIVLWVLENINNIRRELGVSMKVVAQYIDEDTGELTISEEELNERIASAIAHAHTKPETPEAGGDWAHNQAVGPCDS